MKGDTTLCSDFAERRRCADPGHHHAGRPVRAVWISADHGITPTGGMASGQGPGGADLEAGRAESTAKAEATKALVVERRVVCEAAVGAAEACLELGFCERDDPRWPDAPFVNSD